MPQTSTDETKRSAGHLLNPGPVLLLGAPGVGKGTQARLLMGVLHIPQISTGDILRDQIRRGTDLGKTAKALMDRGELVPDDLVNGMVGDRLQQPDSRCGFILDGYPRTLAQAKWLDAYLLADKSSVAGEPMRDLIAISLRVDEAELLKRITGRRSCSVCGHIYNVFSHPPSAEGFCDIDGSPLLQRTDDTESAFRERMKAYALSTEPVISPYRALGRFAEVDGAAAVENVTSEIRDGMRMLRGWEA
jgi:adenylate kinase